MAVPLATTHKFPQVLQLFTSLVRLTSQPSDGSPLQSPNPAGHTLTPHLCRLHQGVAPPTAAHKLPHVPQLFTSFSVLVSQPFERLSSQSAKPGEHVIWHCESAHVGVPLMPTQIVPHAPQFVGSPLVLVSQPFVGSPSQSA